MAERLYTGFVAADEMPQLVAACRFGPQALWLAEQIPQEILIDLQKGRDLLCFKHFKEELAEECANFSTGRIFQDDRELRWERQGERLRVIYLGPADDESLFADTLRACDALATLSSETVYYYLFGEQLEPDDVKKLGKVARAGDFAVVRIPRILRYPLSQEELKGAKYARLAVREYVEEATKRVALFRFQRLEAVPEPGKQR